MYKQFLQNKLNMVFPLGLAPITFTRPGYGAVACGTFVSSIWLETGHNSSTGGSQKPVFKEEIFSLVSLPESRTQQPCCLCHVQWLLLLQLKQILSRVSSKVHFFRFIANFFRRNMVSLMQSKYALHKVAGGTAFRL